ncbi:hypothetical protein GCM10025876_31840 [Demequina litorisediminis]|uniref:Isoleucine--tRNA ligase n=1 Tax=Demequina litorisediminis TaxID=1849022 RepID=A0ABQ6IGR0_9MICO|nr:hypothetical protein GCM10025876_31840 [Demequina litorisediminis]
MVAPGAESAFAGRRLIIGSARLAAYSRELGEDATVVATVTGAALGGLAYTPPFAYFAGFENAHRVLVADFVSVEDGTGIVHMAPGFGEDDAAVCAANGIGTVVPVDSKGRFTAEITDYVGEQVFDANPGIIKDLKARDLVLRHETYDHSLSALLALPQP